jgi:hypothetical protein
MANKPRIALIAIRSTGDPLDPFQAAIIGTVDDAGKQWRFVTCTTNPESADGLTARLKRSNPFDEKPSYTLGTLTTFEKEDARETFADADGGTEWLYNAAALHQAIPFRNVVLCTFYRCTADSPAQQFEDPLVRLDTCGVEMPASGQESVGSMLVIVPRVMSDFIRLRAVWGNLQTRVALSGHRKRAGNFPDEDPSRLDPRHILRFVAIDNVEEYKDGKPRSLWKIPSPLPSPGSSTPIAFPRGAEFNVLKSGLTSQSWVDGSETDWNRRYEVRKNNDLFGLTPLVQEPKTFADDLSVFPAFVDLERVGLLKRGATKDPLVVRRRWCFRVLNNNKNFHPTRLGLRLELEVDFDDKARPLFSAVMPTAAASDVGKLRFAQEQRLGDIRAKLSGSFEPDAATRWILTASSTEADFDADRIVLSAFEAARDRIHAGLRTVEDAQPLTFLPRLFPTDSGRARPWQIVGQIVESQPWKRRTASEPNATVSTGPPRSTLVASFEPCLGIDLMTKKPAKLRRLRAMSVVPGVVTTERRKPVYDIDLTAPTFDHPESFETIPATHEPALQPAIAHRDDLSRLDIGTRLRLVPRTFRGTVPLDAMEKKDIDKALEGLDSKAAGIVSVDALRFRLAQINEKGPFDPRQLNIGFLLMRSVATERLDPPETDVGVNATFGLPVDRVDPGGQDDPPGADRVTALERLGRVLEPRGADPFAPLIFPIEATTDTSRTADYLLTALETITRKRNHTISLVLRAVKTLSSNGQRSSASQKGRLVLVIDPRPFRVVAVEYTDPADTATYESFEVAVRNAAGEGGLSWRVLDRSETVRLLLPPQVIGEAMEKNTGPDRPPDIKPKCAAAVRFGAPTRVEIDPTFFDTAFREPGWNLRRILGYAGQRPPGSRLRDLRLELLYGLTSRATPEDVFISELGGIIGAPPLPLPGAMDNDEPARKRQLALINTVIDAEPNRVAVDKLWKQRPDAELKIEDRVQFRLRTRELTGEKVIHGPSTHLRWPVPGRLPAGNDTGGLIDENVLNNTFRADVSPTDSTSFPGGVAWAFESANILMSVYGRPNADPGGRLNDVYLSALGGYAAVCPRSLVQSI